MVKQVSFAELKSLCPDSFGALSCGTYQKLFTHWDVDKEVHERDYFKLFCILTGQPFKVLEPTPEKESAIYELTRWVNESDAYSKVLPKSLTICDKVIEIPDNVGGLSIGQNILLKQLVDKSRYIEENLSMATAIYLQPLYSGGKFDYQKAKELEKVIGEMPANDIYPIGFFLLSRAARIGREHGISWQLILLSLRQICVRMFPTWLRSEDSQGSYITPY